jgi:drug/metabolite transporter (DMT)-like permease
MEPKRKKAYLALLINTILWGAALPLVKPALSYITPSQFLYFRYLLAAPLMFPFLIFLWLKIKPSLKVLTRIVLLEFFGTPLSLMILYQGLKQT